MRSKLCTLSKEHQKKLEDVVYTIYLHILYVRMFFKKLFQQKRQGEMDELAKYYLLWSGRGKKNILRKKVV